MVNIIVIGSCILMSMLLVLASRLGWRYSRVLNYISIASSIAWLIYANWDLVHDRPVTKTERLPANMHIISGIMPFEATSYDPDVPGRPTSGVDHCEFIIDGRVVQRFNGATDKSRNVYYFEWDSRTVADGKHRAEFTCTDKARNQTRNVWDLLVRNRAI